MELIRYQYPNIRRVTGIDDWFNRAVNENFGWPQLRSMAHPFDNPSNWHQDEEAYYLRVELPGVKKEDVELSLENQVLSVSAESKEDDGNGESLTRYEQTFTLPDNVETDHITAKCENGILTITLPKSEERKPRAIEVS